MVRWSTVAANTTAEALATMTARSALGSGRLSGTADPDRIPARERRAAGASGRAGRRRGAARTAAAPSRSRSMYRTIDIGGGNEALTELRRLAEDGHTDAQIALETIDALRPPSHRTSRCPSPGTRSLRSSQGLAHRRRAPPPGDADGNQRVRQFRDLAIRLQQRDDLDAIAGSGRVARTSVATSESAGAGPARAPRQAAGTGHRA